MNAAKELEAANLRERRQREFNEIQEKVRARDAAREQERQRAIEAILEGMRAKQAEQKASVAALWRQAEQKAREQPRPAPSGEPAAKRQRCLPQEMKDLRSEIRRYNKLTEKEAKTFQKQQMRIWHSDKRLDMDHSVEEREHAVQMFNVALNIRTQR